MLIKDKTIKFVEKVADNDFKSVKWVKNKELKIYYDSLLIINNKYYKVLDVTESLTEYVVKLQKIESVITF